MKRTILLATNVAVSHHQIGCCRYYCHSRPHCYQMIYTKEVYIRCSRWNPRSCGGDRPDKPLGLLPSGVREPELCIDSY